MEAKSWVDVSAESHFPLQNLPYGVFTTKKDTKPRIGVAIGALILDLKAASKLPLIGGTRAAQEGALQKETLNQLMSMGKDAWREVRAAIRQVLSSDEASLRDNSTLRQAAMVPQAEATMKLPVQVGDYTDFYTCMEHARNASAIKTGWRVLSPNWLHLPVGYHGRASSVVVSGTDIRRPWGQAVPAPPANANFISRFLQGWWSTTAQPAPEERPSAALDYELEVACLIGGGNRLGDAVPVDEASDVIFGLTLMNDWSARDLQRWEMFPLGPFNSKNFATAISPWIVPLEALEPFRKACPQQSPQVLPYLTPKQRSTLDISLEASLQPEGGHATTITRTNFQQLHWTLEQMIAHHTYGGCNLRPGDMIATGTVSSSGPKGQGCLMELSWGGAKLVELEGGETRTYLKDGDRVTLTGYCQGEGFRVGFGECTGVVLPARKR